MALYKKSFETQRFLVLETDRAPLFTPTGSQEAWTFLCPLNLPEIALSAKHKEGYHHHTKRAH
jgi:hypothetical protein